MSCQQYQLLHLIKVLPYTITNFYEQENKNNKFDKRTLKRSFCTIFWWYFACCSSSSSWLFVYTIPHVSHFTWPKSFCPTSWKAWNLWIGQWDKTEKQLFIFFDSLPRM